MQLDLTPEEVRWINRKVASGEYDSPDALICEALRLLQEREAERHHVTVLSDRDRDLFLAVLDADDEPNEAVRDAAKAHKGLIAK